MKKVLIFILLVAFNNTHANEVECLSQNIYHESRGESYLDMVSTSFVVLNRINHSKYPITYCDVIKQKLKSCAFSWVCNKTKINKKSNSWHMSKVIADFFINNHMYIDDPTNGSLFYNRPDSMWYSGKINVNLKTENHMFWNPL